MPELARREDFGVDDDAALGAAERDVDDGAFPRHPHREGFDLVQGDVGVVADAAFSRPPVDVVLHAIAGEDPVRTWAHLYGEVARELALDLRQNLTHPSPTPHHLCRSAQLPLLISPCVPLAYQLHLHI